MGDRAFLNKAAQSQIVLMCGCNRVAVREASGHIDQSCLHKVAANRAKGILDSTETGVITCRPVEILEEIEQTLLFSVWGCQARLRFCMHVCSNCAKRSSCPFGLLSIAEELNTSSTDLF